MILSVSQDGRSVKWREYFHGEKYEVVDELLKESIHITNDVRDKLVNAFHEEAFDYWINLDTGVITFDSIA